MCMLLDSAFGKRIGQIQVIGTRFGDELQFIDTRLCDLANTMPTLFPPEASRTNSQTFQAAGLAGWAEKVGFSSSCRWSCKTTAAHLLADML